MPWGAIIGALIGAGGSALSASGSSKQTKGEIRNRIDAIEDARKQRERLIGDAEDNEFRGDFGLEDIFGSNIEDLDLSDAQLEAILSNLDTLDPLSGLLSGTNDLVNDEALRRINGFSPSFGGDLEALGQQAGQLARGFVPFEDVMNITNDRQSLANTVGTPGTQRAATLQDLGLSRIDAMKQGASLLERITGIAENVSPVNNQLDPRSFFVSPADQQSTNLLNATNRAAPNPAAEQLFGQEFGAIQHEATIRGGLPVAQNSSQLIGQGVSDASSAYLAYLAARDNGLGPKKDRPNNE